MHAGEHERIVLPMTTILEARQAAGLTRGEVGAAINRSAQWLNTVEVGIAALKPEHEKIILTAIGRLHRFAATVAEAKARLTADLKLPPARHAS